MSLNVHTKQGPIQFDGPHTSTASLLAQSGVYVISTIVNGLHRVLDAGESEDIQNRVNSHDRKNQWDSHISDRLYVSACYCSATDRMVLESAVRGAHNPPCGIR